MSQENVEILRRSIEAFNRGDWEGVVAEFSPEFEYVSTGALPGARGVARGPDGYREYLLGWLVREFADSRVELHEVIDLGDRVVEASTNRGRGRQSGAEVAWDIWIVWSFRDGQVVHGRGFTSRAEALEAVGLSE